MPAGIIKMRKATIVTVTCDRDGSLERFLESLVHCRRFREIAVLILLNGESPSTESILTRYHARYENIEFLKAKKARKGQARNILLRHVRTELVYFLDDDVIVSGDTCSVMLESMENYPGADIIGGPNLTPPGSNLFQVAQGAVLGSFFGTLWMSRRYTRCGEPSAADERMLILCNLAFRMRVFEKSNICFNDSIICAEENLLLQELMCAGYRAVYIPGLAVYHERRKNYTEFCRQIFTYGRGRCQAAKCRFRVDNLLYCIPAMFLVYLGALLVGHWPGYLLPGYAYLTVCLFNAAKKAIETQHRSLFWVFLVLFPTIHLAYGAGFLFEALRWKSVLASCQSSDFGRKRDYAQEAL